MTVTRIKRLVNPNRKRKNPKRRLTPKQIKHFGTKAQKAALKRKRSAARATARPARRVKRRAARPRAVNPANLITLGLINPERKRKVTKKMATKRRRTRRTTTKAVNPRRRRTRRANPVVHTRRRRTRRVARRNGTRIYVMKRNGRRTGARRNPEMFGMTGASAGKAILAGLVGVYATKTVAPMVASAVPSVGSSAVIAAVISGVVAWGGGLLVGKWDKQAGAGFMFGGLMQAGSQLLNTIMPASPLSLSGLGDFVPASFPVPQNPIRAAAMQRAIGAPQIMPAASNLSGMAASAMFH